MNRIMNRIVTLLSLILLMSCTQRETNFPVYAWTGGLNDASDKEIRAEFSKLADRGITGLMYNGGHAPETYRRVGRIAKKVGLEFHAWIPAMVQGENQKLPPDLYAVNGLGESSFYKPAYVDYYKFLCPSREEVFLFLADLYGRIADIPEVDGIHLDYIRFPDVILAEGLWEKYGLVMDREYPQFDYCYCDHCVNGFEKLSGLNIRSVEDPSQVEAWKQYRCDLITSIVNRLADTVHSRGKLISAAVFPGPHSIAQKIVRQEWDKWQLDAFYPMNYNDFYLKGTRWIGEVCLEGTTAINNRVPLYSGLFICPRPEQRDEEPDPENKGLVPDELQEAVRESLNNNAAGICLFTPGRMTEEHWEALEEILYAPGR